MIKDKLKYIPIVLVALIAAVLRLVNLGYSDYQGDEIKAFLVPDPGQNVFTFLITQRKGPLQFFVTYFLKLFDPNYTHNFFIRVPFAIAGVLAVFFFYKFVKIHFGEKVAFYASFFFATNGLFVGLTRIVQYQSLVLLFAVLTLYFLSKSVTDPKWKITGIYLGFISWALCILAHYDGVFIAPFAFYLLIKWFLQNRRDKTSIKHLIISLVVSGLMLAAFYIPFVVAISKATLEYWNSRLGNYNGKITSSNYLFQIYNPIYALKIYIALFFIGLLNFRKRKFEYMALLLWVAFTILFFEGIVKVSGTHIFNYILPLTVVLGFGIVETENLLIFIFSKLKLSKKIPQIILYLSVFVIFLFLTAQTYWIFVDHSHEYPWEAKDFLIWNFNMPSTAFNLSLFGFPYYRNWEGIAAYMAKDNSHSGKKFYATNERDSITRFYLPYEKSENKAGYFVNVDNPQSFTSRTKSDKGKYWMAKYPPVYIFSNNGNEQAKIYYMEPGILDEIIARGF
ncbi:MAG TPA: glycosyltransferase family 39 protein [Candidatus Saccharimonadales bacterium]|nr:glycosyltransferase family 39 protein [Candidatus Saccharimonadales bacterium]